MWPLLQAFDFAAYRVDDAHFILVLRDKLMGIPAGPGTLGELPNREHPPLPLSNDNLAAWSAYIVTTFALRPQDVGLILPTRDSGKQAGDDYELFTDNEKSLHSIQVEAAIARQARLLMPQGVELGGAMSSGVDKRAVFVVHGRDAALQQAVFALLRAIDLRPLEWSELRSLTGKPNPYVGEILDVGFSMAQAAVVVLSGEDEARLHPTLHGKSEPGHEVLPTLQPRQNVLLEAGMALGRFEDRTVLIQCGDVRPMSDILGRHILKLHNGPEARKDFVERLRTAGCAVRDFGSAWLSEGDLVPAVKQASAWSKGPGAAQAVQHALSDVERDILLHMLYADHYCRRTNGGPQPEHIEAGELAFYDPNNREVAIDYVLACRRLAKAEFITSSVVDNAGMHYRLTDSGREHAASLRAEGLRPSKGPWPEARFPPRRRRV
jgi:predicted nucleotide-binding protein